MRALAPIALVGLLVAGCATTAPRPGASYVAEGVQHAVTMRAVERGMDPVALDGELQSLRSAPGNLGVMLLRRDGVLTIVAEWRGEEDARRAGGEPFEVLFEAVEFERAEATDEELRNSGSASSRHSGASSQIPRREP